MPRVLTEREENAQQRDEGESLDCARVPLAVLSPAVLSFPSLRADQWSLGAHRQMIHAVGERPEIASKQPRVKEGQATRGRSARIEVAFCGSPDAPVAQVDRAAVS